MPRRKFDAPDTIRATRTHVFERLDQWQYCDFEDQDEKFICAMQRAGYIATTPSTTPGTKLPRAGYERP
jgi:hypothetical protein